MDERTIILNELAQGLRPVPDGIAWFESLDDEEQINTLHVLGLFLLQAGATNDDAAESIERAGLKPTHTPAVLIARDPLPLYLGKVIGLPKEERLKSFRLLVALFTVADERRRRTRCANDCNHAWHHLDSRP